ncbi:MAG: VanZ family protein [Vicinamibacterales bacterium]
MTPSSFLSAWGPVVSYMGLIFVVSGTSDLPSLPGGGWDKAIHFGEYLILAVLLVRALARSRWLRPSVQAAAAAAFLATLYGLTDEVHQAFVPGRAVELADFLSDAAGALAGAVAVYCWGIISALFARMPASHDERGAGR